MDFNEHLSTRTRRASKEVMIGTLKSAFGMLPVLGPAINEIVFDIGGRISAARLESFVYYLKEITDKLDEEKINKDYLQGEDFFDLSRNILEGVLKTKSRMKHKTFAHIFIDSIERQINYEEDLNSIFIRYLEELKPSHIHLLKYFVDNESDFNEIETYSNLLEHYKKKHPDASIDKYEFKLYCMELEARSLINTGRGLADYNAKGGMLALESYKRSSLIITSIGKKFIAFVKEEDSSPE